MFAVPKFLRAAIVLVGITLLAACGGGGSNIETALGGGDAPTVVGDVATPSISELDASVPTVQISGSQENAPLGTNPEYNVAPATDSIVTRPASKAGSQVSENELFWVAVVKRGEIAVPGLPSPPFYEGDQVDLYMHYEVYDGALTISREWHLEAAGLSLIQPAVVHPAPGVYEATLQFTIPYGSANTFAEFIAIIGAAKSTSAVVIPDQGDFRSVSFEILETPTLPPVHYPADPDPENDDQGGGGGCIPEFIDVDFTSDTEVYVESAKDLSNVVLEFDDGVHQKWDDLNQGTTGTFYGTGANDGKYIVSVWVKSGCNASGDGPGYGEYFDRPTYEAVGMAQLAWEDLIVGSDYDYNDFVCRLNVSETRNLNNELVQVQMTVKAVARGAGYGGQWQMNLDASFPGATVYALVDQYYADGTRHGDQVVWTSSDGASVPIFSSTKESLPTPPESSYATNVIAGSTFIDGDYAEVTILLDQPMAQGTYTPLPYEPELLVKKDATSTWVIGLWKEPGDPVDINGRPLGFIVPDTYAWPLETKRIYYCYDRFNAWIDWINAGGTGTEPDWYNDTPVRDTFHISLFK